MGDEVEVCDAVVTSRKLASVRRVTEITPIEGADFVELARVDGWQCVVKKGDFTVGDQGVYFEIDSVPPDADPFKFLWKFEEPRPRSYRIKTVKLRGELSQGLFMPLSDFPQVPVGIGDGEDLTEFLGVTLYERPQEKWQKTAAKRGNFPNWLPKTDEERIQNCGWVLEKWAEANVPWYATVKLDGTSATYTQDPQTDEFHVCSRNLSVKDGENVYWDMARKYRIEQALAYYDGRYSFQGEICGPGIQGNKLGLKEVDFFVFNVIDRNANVYLPLEEMVLVCADMGLQTVPIAESHDAWAPGGVNDWSIARCLEYAEGKYAGTQNEREGLVFRINKPRPIWQGRDITSFKAISNKFLLKEKD